MPPEETEQGFDTASIAAAFGAVDFEAEAEDTDDDAETPAGEEPAAHEPETPAATQTDDDGPGDIRVALRQARAETKAMRDQLAAIQAERAQQQAAQQEAAQRQYVQQQIESMDPEDVPAYL